MDNNGLKELSACYRCAYCKWPRTVDDNGGACKCKLMKYKTIDVYVSGGETPRWCPLNKNTETAFCERCGAYGAVIKHRVPNTSKNTNGRIVYSADNVVLLCQQCHIKEHSEEDKMRSGRSANG